MYLAAKLQPLTNVPKGTIYLGDGDFDFQCQACPSNIKERLAKYDDKKVREEK